MITCSMSAQWDSGIFATKNFCFDGKLERIIFLFYFRRQDTYGCEYILNVK